MIRIPAQNVGDPLNHRGNEIAIPRLDGLVSLEASTREHMVGNSLPECPVSDIHSVRNSIDVDNVNFIQV